MSRLIMCSFSLILLVVLSAPLSAISIIGGPTATTLLWSTDDAYYFGPGGKLGLSATKPLTPNLDLQIEGLLSFTRIQFEGSDLQFDSDGDGLFSEDPFDLLDNDGDGLIDEDLVEKFHGQGHYQFWGIETPILLSWKPDFLHQSGVSFIFGASPKFLFAQMYHLYGKTLVFPVDFENPSWNKNRKDWMFPGYDFDVAALIGFQYATGPYSLSFRVEHGLVPRNYTSILEAVMVQCHDYYKDEYAQQLYNAHDFSLELMFGYRL